MLFLYLLPRFVNNLFFNRNQHIKYRLVFESLIDFASLFLRRTIDGRVKDPLEFGVIQVRIVAIVEYQIVPNGVT